eukprot:6647018-Prymnesium_polylepis.1
MAGAAAVAKAESEATVDGPVSEFEHPLSTHPLSEDGTLYAPEEEHEVDSPDTRFPVPPQRATDGPPPPPLPKSVGTSAAAAAESEGVSIGGVDMSAVSTK